MEEKYSLGFYEETEEEHKESSDYAESILTGFAKKNISYQQALVILQKVTACVIGAADMPLNDCLTASDAFKLNVNMYLTEIIRKK